jgi:uncharacterized protein (TIGR02001 family)
MKPTLGKHINHFSQWEEKMNFTKKLTPMVIAGTMAASAFMAVPMAAQADASASVAVSNLYLWRGQNLSPDGGVVSGSLDYSHESGFYAGVWGTSENGGSETDLYLGYGGEIKGFKYDVSYWWYLYPETRTGESAFGAGDSTQLDMSDTDASEYVVSLGYGPGTFTAYIQADSDLDDDKYFTLSGEFGKFSATYGWWDLENPDAADEYSHITLGFAATDELSFSVSKASSDRSDDLGVEEDPLFAVTWGKSFDL